MKKSARCLFKIIIIIFTHRRCLLFFFFFLLCACGPSDVLCARVFFLISVFIQSFVEIYYFFSFLYYTLLRTSKHNHVDKIWHAGSAINQNQRSDNKMIHFFWGDGCFGFQIQKFNVCPFSLLHVLYRSFFLLKNWIKTDIFIINFVMIIQFIDIDFALLHAWRVLSFRSFPFLYFLKANFFFFFLLFLLLIEKGKFNE